MGERAKYYHIWKKGTPVEKSLLIKVEGNKMHSLYSNLGIEDLLSKTGIKIHEHGDVFINEDYNINRISDKRAEKKIRDYQRGINLPNLN